MARSVWKGPFVEESLMKKVDKYKDDPKKIPIKTWSRKSTILPDFVGVSFQIYNGKKFIPITISEDMVGHKLGEFSPTRTFYGHTPADKKAKRKKLINTKMIKKKFQLKHGQESQQSYLTLLVLVFKFIMVKNLFQSLYRKIWLDIS